MFGNSYKQQLSVTKQMAVIGPLCNIATVLGAAYNENASKRFSKLMTEM